LSIFILIKAAVRGWAFHLRLKPTVTLIPISDTPPAWDRRRRTTLQMIKMMIAAPAAHATTTPISARRERWKIVFPPLLAAGGPEVGCVGNSLCDSDGL
jgi:hypothetical protein